MDLIEVNGEIILPVAFYGENRNGQCLEYSKKVWNKFGVKVNYIKSNFPLDSHGFAINKFIDKCKEILL